MGAEWEKLSDSKWVLTLDDEIIGSIEKGREKYTARVRTGYLNTEWFDSLTDAKIWVESSYGIGLTKKRKSKSVSVKKESPIKKTVLNRQARKSPMSKPANANKPVKIILEVTFKNEYDSITFMGNLARFREDLPFSSCKTLKSSRK